MKSYDEFDRGLTAEQKEKARKLFEEIIAPYKGQEPIILVSNDPDDVNYVRKVNTGGDS